MDQLSVVSPGGSFIYSDDAIQNIRKNALFIYLYDDPMNIKKRISNLETRGILGLERTSFEDLCQERHKLYQQAAHIQFNLNHYGFDQVTNQIINYLTFIL